MPFRLATIIVSSNPTNFVNAHCYEQVSGVTAHSLHQKPDRNNAHWQSWLEYCSQLWQAEILGLGIVSQNVLILVLFFSGEVTSTRITIVDSTYCGKYAVPLFLGHPVLSYIYLFEYIPQFTST